MLNPITAYFNAKVQRKLIAVITVLVIVILGSLGLYWTNSEQKKSSSALETRAEMMANLLGQTLSTAMWNIELKLVQKNIEAVMIDPEVHAIEVYNAVDPDPVASAIREGDPVEGIIREADIMYTDSKGQTQAVGKVHLVYTRELVNWNTGRSQQLLLMGIVGLVIILVAGIYVLLNRMISKPLAEMTGLMDRLAGGDCDIVGWYIGK